MAEFAPLVIDVSTGAAVRKRLGSADFLAVNKLVPLTGTGLTIGETGDTVTIGDDLTVTGDLSVTGTETVTTSATLDGTINLGTGNNGDTINIGSGTSDFANLKTDLLLGTGLVKIGGSVTNYLTQLWLAKAGATPASAAYNLNATGTEAGAYAIGINSALLTNSSATNLMSVLDDLDSAIAGSSSLDEIINSATFDNDVNIAATKDILLKNSAGTVTGLSITAAALTSLDSSGALTLGGTSATSVSIGLSGITATVNGALTVSETTTLNGNTVIGDATTDTIDATARVKNDLYFRHDTATTIIRVRREDGTTVGTVPGTFVFRGAASAAADGATDAATGGAANWTSGAGGAASATNQAGMGGSVALICGAGGAGNTANDGANGGDMFIRGGLGGAGGASSNGGDGGVCTTVGAQGGSATGTNTPGRGGNFLCGAGDAGTGGTGAADGGDVFILAGLEANGGSKGSINIGIEYLGTQYTSRVEIGTVVDVDTFVRGDLSVDEEFLANGNSTLGDAITDTITFTGRVTSATNLVPIADNSSSLGISGLGWSAIWMRGPDGTTNNLASSASAAASGADAIGYFKNSLADATPNTVQDALDDIYATMAGANSLAEIMEAAAADNSVNLGVATDKTLQLFNNTAAETATLLKLSVENVSGTVSSKALDIVMGAAGGVSSGNGITESMNATSTGDAMDVTMVAGATGKGIDMHLANAGTGTTGILVDRTGASGAAFRSTNAGSGGVLSGSVELVETGGAFSIVQETPAGSGAGAFYSYADGNGNHIWLDMTPAAAATGNGFVAISNANSSPGSGLLFINHLGGGTSVDVQDSGTSVFKITGAGVATLDSNGGSLGLGNTNSTAVSLGKAGITTTNNGALTVTEAFVANGNSTLGDAATDTITFTGRVASATNLTPIADNSSKLGVSGLGWSEIWLRGPDGTTNNLAAATSAAASGAEVIGYFKNSAADAAPNTVQDALDDIYATMAASNTLDELINATSPDNNVNIPTGNEIIFSDNGVNLTNDMMALNRTGASATTDIMSISGSGASGWGTGATIVYGINMSIDPTGGTTSNARGINLTMGAGTGTGITVTQNSSVAQAMLLNNTVGTTNDALLISGGQLHMSSTAGRFFFEGTAFTANATAASALTTSAGALTITAAAASTWSTSAGALTLTSAAAATWKTTAGALTVDAATALNLGTSDATSVSVSKAGVTTTVNGALTVTEAFVANGNVTLGDAATDTVEFIGRIKTATNITPIADNSSKLGVSGLGWSEIWLRGPDGTTNNLASATSAAASGAEVIGYFKNSAADAAPNTVQDALDDLYAGTNLTLYFTAEAATGGLTAKQLIAFSNQSGTPVAAKADADGGGTVIRAVAIVNATVSGAATATLIRPGQEVTIPDALWITAPVAADVGKAVYMAKTPGSYTMDVSGFVTGDTVQQVGVLTFGSGTADTGRLMFLPQTADTL